MEALAAVGLAGNIVQFIDFSCKLFDQANSIYHSHTGSSESTQDLGYIAQHLQSLSAKLSRDAHTQPQAQNSVALQNQRDLRQLAQKCQGASNELQSALHALKAKDSNSKWSSFRAALSSTWKQAEVDALAKRLSDYRLELILQLQVLEK